jgi:hypothetical protein
MNTGTWQRPDGCVCGGPTAPCQTWCDACREAARKFEIANPVILVHKGVRPLSAGDIRRLAVNLDGLGIPDNAPAEIRTPITGDRHKVDIAFRRPPTTTTATPTEGNTQQP